MRAADRRILISPGRRSAERDRHHAGPSGPRGSLGFLPIAVFRPRARAPSGTRRSAHEKTRCIDTDPGKMLRKAGTIAGRGGRGQAGQPRPPSRCSRGAIAFRGPDVARAGPRSPPPGGRRPSLPTPSRSPGAPPPRCPARRGRRRGPRPSSPLPRCGSRTAAGFVQVPAAQRRSGHTATPSHLVDRTSPRSRCDRGKE